MLRRRQEIRIEAEAKVAEQADAEALVRHSEGASLVFLPFHLRGNQPLGAVDDPLDDLLDPLPAAVLVLAAEDMDLDAEPEEGPAAVTAQLLDALSDAERLAELASKDVHEAEAATQQVHAELEAETGQAVDPENLAKLKQQLQELEAQAEKARRRAARNTAKAQAAHQEVESMGSLPP
jgi:hypothetical protein